MKWLDELVVHYKETYLGGAHTQSRTAVMHNVIKREVKPKFSLNSCLFNLEIPKNQYSCQKRLEQTKTVHSWLQTAPRSCKSQRFQVKCNANPQQERKRDENGFSLSFLNFKEFQKKNNLELMRMFVRSC